MVRAQSIAEEILQNLAAPKRDGNVFPLILRKKPEHGSDVKRPPNGMSKLKSQIRRR